MLTGIRVIVSDATIEAEGLKEFFMSAGKAAINIEKVANNPVRAWETASKLVSAAATENPIAALATTTDFIHLAATGGGLKVVQKRRGL